MRRLHYSISGAVWLFRQPVLKRGDWGGTTWLRRPNPPNLPFSIYLFRAASSSRSTRRSTLPAIDLGKSARKTTLRGSL